MRIYRKDFKETLRKIPLSEKERRYVEGVFERSLKKGEGLSKYRIEEEIRQLKHKSDDPLTPYEVKKLGEKLKEPFEEKK